MLLTGSKKLITKKIANSFSLTIKEFYPAISESILGKEINFAKEFIDNEPFSIVENHSCFI